MKLLFRYIKLFGLSQGIYLWRLDKRLCDDPQRCEAGADACSEVADECIQFALREKNPFGLRAYASTAKFYKKLEAALRKRMIALSQAPEKQ